ncbi:MAG: D-alanine--D-alanine ligase family protein [Gammaproteobacteria bacterium]
MPSGTDSATREISRRGSIKKSITNLLVVTGDHAAYDATKPGGRYSDEDFEAHRIMSEAFAAMDDFNVTVCADHEWLLDGLRASPPDLVVNFCDTGFRNVAVHEHVLPAYLDMLGIPYTGAQPAAMALCYDKQIVRLLADALGVAVPRETFLPGAGDAQMPGFYPALIKPNRADGSVGITKDSVIHNEAEARAYLAWLREALPGCEALYQEYLPGPEYGIGAIGNPETNLRILPMLEVDFSGLPDGLNPILSYESKALPDSPYWTDIVFKRASAGRELEAALADDCRRLFQRLGLRDYGRFDFRCADDGTPRLMEVNPNPAWGYDAKLVLMAGFAGISYPDMLRLIVEAAATRLSQA